MTRAGALDGTLRARIPDVGNVTAFRNQLVHNYGAVDAAIVWGIVTGSVPPIHQILSGLLQSRNPSDL